jgi:hypothetical protein
MQRMAEEPPIPTAKDAYEGLRGLALDAVASGLPDPDPAHPSVSGVVVDIPAQGGCATLVAMTDSTTSLYTSVGGGTIGAGSHPAVATATRRLLSTIQLNLERFVSETSISHPPPGTVRLFVLTPGGRRVTDIPEDAFWGRVEHALTPVIAAAQGTITAVREIGGSHPGRQ